MLSARRGSCPRSESLLARRVRLRRRRRPRMPPPLPSRSARRNARAHCRRRACGDAAFCGAIRRGGSSALSSSRSRRVDPALPLAVGVARSPLAWRRAAGRAAAQSAASSAARRAVLVLASARALKACSTACPLHYLYARGGSQSWQSPSQFSQFCQSPSQPSHAVCLRLPWSKWMDHPPTLSTSCGRNVDTLMAPAPAVDKWGADGCSVFRDETGSRPARSDDRRALGRRHPAGAASPHGSL